jgi:hypothetical protein
MKNPWQAIINVHIISREIDVIQICNLQKKYKDVMNYNKKSPKKGRIAKNQNKNKKTEANLLPLKVNSLQYNEFGYKPPHHPIRKPYQACFQFLLSSV